MAKTKILLREEVENLGPRGEIVEVKAGYARNYLLPRKLAVEATASNVKQIDQERAALMRREAKDRSSAEAQSSQMGALSLSFERKVGEHGILYGSVTSMDIAEALKDKGFEIDRRRILLPDVIKETGDFTVKVRLHREVTVEVPVTVTGEGGAQTSRAAAAAPAEDSTATTTTDDATPAPATGAEASADEEPEASADEES